MRQLVDADATVDLFAGSQTLSRAFRQTKKHLYIPLDIRENVYSAVHQKWVQNLAFGIMKETPQQILAKIALYCKLQCPGLARLKLGEVWGSPCCTTFSKMGVINGVHQ